MISDSLTAKTQANSQIISTKTQEKTPVNLELSVSKRMKGKWKHLANKQTLREFYLQETGSKGKFED